MYNLNGGGERRAGLRYNNGPQKTLLSTFRNPSNDPESQVAGPTTKRTTRASSRAKGASTKNDCSSGGEDEISGFNPPSVTTSPRGARIRRRIPVPETSHNNGMDDQDGYADIDDFDVPAQARPKPKALAKLPEDIVPTNWKSTKERDEETQRLLRERNSARVNPQHIRGAGFDTNSARPTLGSSWDKGPGKKKLGATYKKKSVAQPRPDSKIKLEVRSLDSDDESEGKDELQRATSKFGSTQTKKEFKDPRKLHPIPVEEEVQPQARPFRNPLLVHPLPPKETGRQNGTNFMGAGSLRPQSKVFQDPSGKYGLLGKGPGPPAEIEQMGAMGFVDPFAKKYGLPYEAEEPESQIQANYIDESDDEITSAKNGSDKGGSKKRKASSIYPKGGTIDLSTPKPSYRDDVGFSSPSDDAEGLIGGSQSSTLESQFPSSSQVRHMDDISLELRETKLREQGKKRKKKLEAVDVCVLCDAVLPPGVLDKWKDGDGELQPIRMAEWTEICNNHKATDLQKEWEEKGYPVIKWKGLKRRVEKHHQFLVDIIKNKVPSPFREAFAKQQKDIRGNAALLLRKDHQLQYPGYYGPRGSGILLHEITMRLASFVGDAGKQDGLIAQGGVAAFIQTVLVPELGVRLIMEDMNVREAKARIILDESREIGEKLNMDEFTEDIYDEEDGPWFDINAKTPEVVKKKKGLLDAWRDNDDDDDY